MRTVVVPNGLKPDRDVDVVVGKPICTPEELGMSPDAVRTNERFIPLILKNLGIVKGTTQIRRDRPDLFCDVPKGLSFFTICIGNPRKHHSSTWITFLVGE